MKRLDSNGAATGLLVMLIVMALLFFGALGFGLWAFTSRQDYKSNSDKKSAAAVAIAQKETATAKDNEFVEKEKSPLKKYAAPEAYGSLSLNYPKTWSALINESGQGTNPVDGFFYPNFIPGSGGNAASTTASYALRISVTSTSYDTIVKTFDGPAASGLAKVTSFKPDKVAGVAGVRVDGAIYPNKQGALVILPLRDKTIEVWTESTTFLNDFNTIILPSLTFVP
jgi:hypothetical protein